MNVRFDRLAAGGAGCVIGRGTVGIGTGLVSAAEPPDISGKSVTGSRGAGGGNGGSGAGPGTTADASAGLAVTTVLGCSRGGG